MLRNIAVSKISRRAILKFSAMSPFLLSPFLLLARNALAVTAIESVVGGEDGYRAWLRYPEIEDVAVRQTYRLAITSIAVLSTSATANVVRDELTNGLTAMLGERVPASRGMLPGSIVVATSKSPLIGNLIPEADLMNLGPDGFLIRRVKNGDSKLILIVSETDVGTLYGAFAFLRLIQTDQSLEQLSMQESPKNPLRLLAHWDNSDGSIERGYAGKSLWKWKELPEHVDERLLDYARINASIGINGVVLNNVNAEPEILDA